MEHGRRRPTRGKVRKLTAMKATFRKLQLTARARKSLGGDRDMNLRRPFCYSGHGVGCFRARVYLAASRGRMVPALTASLTKARFRPKEGMGAKDEPLVWRWRGEHAGVGNECRKRKTIDLPRRYEERHTRTDCSARAR